LEYMRNSILTSSLAIAIVGLLVGIGSGYFYASSHYQPIIKEHEDQLEELSSQINDLNSSINSLLSEKSHLNVLVSSLEAEKAIVQTHLSQAQETISQYEAEIASYEIYIANLENEVSILQILSSQHNSTITSLQSEISELESNMEKIVGIQVTQHYHWEYSTGYWSTSKWQWDLPITLSTYAEYYFRPRPPTWKDWVDMAKDPDDDYYITSMVQKINEASLLERFTESEKVEFVIAFVQSLPYTVDEVTTEWDEYPRYPIETLFDRGGDCEDTSILVAALLDRMGYDVCLLILENENHCAVGINIEGAYGSYYEDNGKKYFYLETTGEGWKIGETPPVFIDTSAYVYPLNP
jgi:hypothetical protein